MTNLPDESVSAAPQASQNPHDPQDAQTTPHSRFEAGAAWAQDVAVQQAQYILVATTNFLTTMTTLIISAMGLVTALAWNKAISDWLPTVKWLNFRDPLVREFAYALGVTIIAVLTISILSVFNLRLKKGQKILVKEKDA